MMTMCQKDSNSRLFLEWRADPTEKVSKKSSFRWPEKSKLAGRKSATRMFAREKITKPITIFVAKMLRVSIKMCLPIVQSKATQLRKKLQLPKPHF